MNRTVYLIYVRHDDVAEVVHKEYTETDAAEFCRLMNEKWESMGWYYSYELQPQKEG